MEYNPHNPEVAGSSPVPAPTKKARLLTCFFVFVSAGHNIITNAVSISFDRLWSTSFRFSGHKMMLSSTNDVMLRINDVALHANGCSLSLEKYNKNRPVPKLCTRILENQLASILFCLLVSNKA